MAPLQHYVLKKVLFFYLILLLFITSSFISAQPRRLLSEDDEDLPIIKKKSNSNKNQTKLIKPTTTTSTSTSTTSSKNQTKLIKPSTASTSSKNQTKVITKLPSDSSKNKTKLIKATSSSNSTIKSPFKKLNTTSKISANSTHSTNKLSDPSKLNKTTKPISTKESKSQIEKSVLATKSNSKSLKKPSWIDEEDDDDDDLVAEFRGLPSKFQESIVPDLEKISQTSRNYLTKYNKEFTRGFKPYVGNKYASKIASLVSLTFIIIPLILVSLIFTRIKAFFSLQKLLIFIQIYLSIYFTILSLSSLATGLEPLRFFYSTSQSTYVCVQVMQTLGYVLYLLLLLMYLILVFSTETGLVTKSLGLAQTFVGLAVGLHYYMTVFHRAVMHQPPKTSWKVHALYATCFLLICLLARADRRKKAYLEEGGGDGKRS
ncbi:cell wall integrity/stress response component-like protein [Perilla frutescens var. hirtella]|uniref:Cell wall integrity/stress response component-like protein n=1 Tax=Perilla frutescens var. hirtella TaxID=608512 RepID=A0AAD4P0U5_PERFH|nr:cell wall integrity/stress response component-like protein [Perilla frutescens var. hirtella]